MLMNPSIARCMTRTLAAAIGGFTLLNLMGEMIHPGFDANLWWIDLRVLPGTIATVFLLAVAASLLAYAAGSRATGWRNLAAVLPIVLACLGAISNTLIYFSLTANGQINTPLPLPLSFFIAIALATIAFDWMRNSREADRNTARPITAWAIACITMTTLLVGFPIAQMFFFGKTNYARAVDAIIVPGARAYADGRASVPLADRVRTACALYHDGRAPLLIFSGGPGDGEIHETEAMQQLAISLGVPPDAILLDPQGLSTQQTALHTHRMLDRLDIQRAIVVSHFYHLPRIKLAYQRQGREVLTVPATESYTLRAMPVYMLREVAALWWYYVQPLVG